MKVDACDDCLRGVLSALSHEVRNPLAAIASSLYVLKASQAGSQSAQRAIAIMERQVGRLTLVIDSVTDAARIGQGKVQLNRSIRDLRQTLSEAAKAHEDLFSGRHVQLQLQVPSVPVMALADEQRLQEIVSKLLDNAARFAPSQTVVVLALECDEQERVARIRVQDAGAGMESAESKRFFDAAPGASLPTANGRGELGLAMMLVKGLAELHGGTVRAHSDGPGLGACMTVELPLLESGQS